MTALRHEVAFQAGLEPWLHAHDVRHEVVDGQLVVNPPPRPRHQLVVTDLVVALHRAAPRDVRVFGSGLGVFYGGGSYVVPDVAVVHDEDITDDGVHVAPLLVVEIRSASTWRLDVGRKREIYAELGVPSYWLVDPDTAVVTVLSLRGGAYVETARGTRLELTEPFPVVVDLAAGR